MADLMPPGGAPAAPHGADGPPPRRPTATGSPSGIRGPRMIMQERAAREARQRAEAERREMERSRAEQEARLLEETQRRAAERPSATGKAGQGSGTDTRQPTDPHPQAQAAPETTQAPRSSVPASVTAAAPKAPAAKPPSQSQQPPLQPAAKQRAPPQTYTASGSGQPPQPSHQQQPGRGSQAGNTGTQPADMAKPRNSFPHAFERWETLSAHWEGLTRYWIRKLEQNKDETNRDPLSQQLARQVTDLSAAGANLFHAVVELQRLRASSERKFQRWFFETRAELERAKEVNAMMEAALQKERRERADAARDAIDQEQGTSKMQKQLAEMRKELSISKEEARRAWEELGRREQEERERTFSLQTGQPTIVGGVQVVPMTQGGPSRRGAARDPAGQELEHGHDYPPEPAPTPPPTAVAGGSHYRSRPPELSETGDRACRGSGGAYSEGEYVVDAQGIPILDVHGERILFAAPPSSNSGSDTEADEYETPASTNPLGSGGHEPPSTSTGDGRWSGTYLEPQDYSGQGYGAPGWETVPRHHHPTRLSDVIEEEEERSRTSASQISRG